MLHAIVFRRSSFTPPGIAALAALPGLVSLRRLQLELSILYYFPHIALGGGWQTTFTYINHLTQAVTCETSFFSDSGDPLVVPFGEGVPYIVEG